MRFKHHITSTGVALAIAAAGFPAAAQAMYAENPPVPFAVAPPVSVSSAAPYALPSNFVTDASSAGSVSSSAPYVLPSNFLTDASSAGFNSASVSGPSVQPTSSGFEWGDAGIGAAGAVVLLGAGLLGAGALRRRPALG